MNNFILTKYGNFVKKMKKNWRLSLVILRCHNWVTFTVSNVYDLEQHNTPDIAEAYYALNFELSVKAVFFTRV